jgi:peptidyl-tRNA hydrolase, PTH1 family
MATSGPKIIAGLGNPGPEYADTRHNVGFWFVDALARQHHLTFRSERRFFGDLCRLMAGPAQCWLLRPATYMNHSGRAVASLAQYYSITPAAILIVHDEIDLPPGQAKLKFGGGHGGHNGLRDIIQQLGSSDFYRLRIGVGHPGHRDHVVPYVLGRPSADDRLAIEGSMARALDEMPRLLEGRYEMVMNELHRGSPPPDAGS